MTPTLAEILVVDTDPKCKTCMYLKHMHGADHDALQSALLNRSLSHSFIASAMSKAGYLISESSVGRHRRMCRDVEGPAQQP